MLLFRKHRRLEDILDYAFKGQGFHGSMEDAWLAIFEEFEEWRRSLQELSQGPLEPLTKPWWAARTANCMRNYDLATGKHTAVAGTTPDLELLPMVQEPSQTQQQTGDNADDDAGPSSNAAIR